jgi:hypothetical protein
VVCVYDGYISGVSMGDMLMCVSMVNVLVCVSIVDMLALCAYGANVSGVCVYGAGDTLVVCFSYTSNNGLLKSI